MRWWIVTVGMLMLLAPEAGADCMAARSFISPATGSRVPADPVLFAFVPWDRPVPGVEVTAGGEEVEAKITHLSTTPTFKSYRIDVDRHQPGDIHVKVSLVVQDSEAVYTEATYTIDPAWKKTSKASEVKAKMLGKEVDAWTCSHNMTYNLEPSVQAPAYRVQWATTVEDYEAGKRQSAVFPFTLQGFFDEKLEHVFTVIKLGHANCLSDTFKWPDALVYVGLAALHEDGTETPASKTPTEVPWSFGQASYGAMTDEFYEEVHGTDEQGNTAAEKKTLKAEAPASSAAGTTAPDAGGGGKGCSIARAGMGHSSGCPLLVVLALLSVVLVGGKLRRCA